MQLDKDLAMLAAFAVSFIVKNVETDEVLDKVKEVVLKYGLIEVLETSEQSEMNDVETVEYFDKIIASIQDKIEEYDALQR